MAWEIDFLEWIHHILHGSDFINQVIKYFSVLGDIGLIWIAIGLLLLCFQSYRKIGVVLLLSLVTGYIFNDLILKKIILRTRPWEQSDALASFVFPLFKEHEGWGFLNHLLGGTLPSGSSFPSGHTFCAFNVTAVLHFSKVKKLRILGWILAPLMALSRIFLCVHFPTDVLAGAVLGFLTGFLFSFLFRNWLFKKKKEEETVCA